MQKYDKKYLQMAQIWASNSYAKRHQVGALIVKDNMIISDGYNGMPKGFDNCCEDITCTCQWVYGCTYTAEPIEKSIDIDRCCGCSYAVLKTKPEVLHAEANAITKLAKCSNTAEGATLYITLSPCIECAKLIIQAGIKRVVYIESYKGDPGVKLLNKAGIEVEQIENIND